MGLALKPKAVEAGTKAFVRMLRREYERRRPGQPNPVPAWEDMRPLDRESFMRCVSAGLAGAETAEFS